MCQTPPDFRLTLSKRRELFKAEDYSHNRHLEEVSCPGSDFLKGPTFARRGCCFCRPPSSFSIPPPFSPNSDPVTSSPGRGKAFRFDDSLRENNVKKKIDKMYTEASTPLALRQAVRLPGCFALSCVTALLFFFLLPLRSFSYILLRTRKRRCSAHFGNFPATRGFVYQLCWLQNVSEKESE